MRLILPTLLVVVVFSQSATRLTASTAARAQGPYYVFDGQSVTEVPRIPDDGQAGRWAAFYLKTGASGSLAAQRWGAEFESSPIEVMESVVTNQEFQRTYAKWCGCEWGSDTFFNVIVPVAIAKSSPALSTGKVEIIIKAEDIGRRIEQMVKAANQSFDFDAEKDAPPQTTEPFAEYVKNVRRALDQYATINNLIFLLADNDAGNIEKRLNQLADEVSNIEKTSPAIHQPSTASSTTNGGKSENAGTVPVPKTQPQPINSKPTANANLQPSAPTKPKEHDGQKVYTVQVGVFTSESRAEAVMSQLKKKQYDAAFIDAGPSGTGPYHVRVGRLPEMQAAQNLRKRLAAEGFDTFIMTLNQ